MIEMVMLAVVIVGGTMGLVAWIFTKINGR